MTFQNDCQALQSMTIFRGVDPAKLKLIAVASHRVEHQAGEVLMRQGHSPEGVLVILEGTADVFRKGPSGDVFLARVGAGEPVGEMSVLTGRSYSATVVTTSRFVALQIEKHAFLEIMQTVPQLALAISRELCRRLEIASERIATLTSQ